MLSPLAGRRIELWVEARGGVAAINPVMRTLVQELEAAGAMADVRVPEHEVVDPENMLDVRPPDLVLLKTATTLSLSLALADDYEVHAFDWPGYGLSSRPTVGTSPSRRSSTGIRGASTATGCERMRRERDVTAVGKATTSSCRQSVTTRCSP